MTPDARPAAPLLRLPPTLRAMLWMAASGILFTVLNTTMKWLAESMEPWTVGFLRYFLGFVVFLPLVWRLGARGVLSARPGLQVARGVCHVGGSLMWFAALRQVSMAEMTAIAFTGPIFICLGAVLLLGERMSWARWASVLCGFAGVLIIVHPWTEGGFGSVNWGMVLLLLAAPSFAGSMLVAKVLTRRDRPDVIVLWQHGMVALLSAPFAALWWTSPSVAQWVWLVGCGLVGAAGHYCVTRAFRAADISAVQSVKFLDLVWASFAGIVVFAHWPDLWTIVGGTVIFTATLWLVHREARAARQARGRASPVAAPQLAPVRT